MEPSDLGNLGGRGMAVLEIQNLNPLLAEWDGDGGFGQGEIGASLQCKGFQIMAWTGRTAVGHWTRLW